METGSLLDSLKSAKDAAFAMPGYVFVFSDSIETTDYASGRRVTTHDATFIKQNIFGASDNDCSNFTHPTTSIIISHGALDKTMHTYHEVETYTKYEVLSSLSAVISLSFTFLTLFFTTAVTIPVHVTKLFTVMFGCCERKISSTSSDHNDVVKEQQLFKLSSSILSPQEEAAAVEIHNPAAGHASLVASSKVISSRTDNDGRFYEAMSEKEGE